MKDNLTLRPVEWTGSGSADSHSGEVTGYQVHGMPDGSTAKIVNFGAPNLNDWQTMRIVAGNSQDKWTGNYSSAEEALAALQRETDDSFLDSGA